MIAKAKVKVEIEITLNDTWQSTCGIDQIFSQAERQAIDAIDKILSESRAIKVAKETSVVSVILENRQ